MSWILYSPVVHQSLEADKLDLKSQPVSTMCRRAILKTNRNKKRDRNRNKNKNSKKKCAWKARGREDYERPLVRSRIVNSIIRLRIGKARVYQEVLVWVSKAAFRGPDGSSLNEVARPLQTNAQLRSFPCDRYYGICSCLQSIQVWMTSPCQ